jgi:hypothetical protein
MFTVPRQRGKLEQPQNGPFTPLRWIMLPRHCGQLGVLLVLLVEETEDLRLFAIGQNSEGWPKTGQPASKTNPGETLTGSVQFTRF